ncbi:hypothetical protein LUZ60_012447 [Juncus effusus]|nr:hypothetical protein LUZ60_012447 [Juncus effusus]
MPSHSPVIHIIETYNITPKPNPVAPRELHLTVWDLPMLSFHYIQKGLLFANQRDLSLEEVIERLKRSLDEALYHFYPLAGRLRLVTCDDGVTCHVEIGHGAELVHAKADGITIADVAETDGLDLPDFLKGFFSLDLAVNFDGCTNPLLAVQVTELDDGFFVGCVFNHAIGDGTSFWEFFSAWAEICRAKSKAGQELVVLSKPPVHDRFFLQGYAEPPIKLPYLSPDQFVVWFKPPPLRERMFHFSSESLAKLKARANEEYGQGTGIISTFQALSALMWRCITRARRVSPSQEIGCRLAIQNRARLQPQLSPNYFGNSIYAMRISTTAGELLSHNLGWAAWLANQAVANHSDSTIRDYMHAYMAKPMVYNLNMFDVYSIMMGSSPRFDMYGCDFGWGKAVAARSGSAHKFDGKVSSYPGWQVGGSVDLEVCLLPEYMSALENDEEFINVVSPPVKLNVLLEAPRK